MVVVINGARVVLMDLCLAQRESVAITDLAYFVLDLIYRLQRVLMKRVGLKEWDRRVGPT